MIAAQCCVRVWASWKGINGNEASSGKTNAQRRRPTTKQKQLSMEWEKVRAGNRANKALLPKMYKEFIQLNTKKPQIICLKNGQRPE